MVIAFVHQYSMFGVLWFILIAIAISSGEEDGFTFNGFRNANIGVDGEAMVPPGGLLQLNNISSMRQIGHAFYSNPLSFRDTSNGTDTILPFSTMFVIQIHSEHCEYSGSGLAFVISPSKDLSGGEPGEYLGLLNSSNNGNSSNHLFAIEFDTVPNFSFQDLECGHVGIIVNSMTSISSACAGYFRYAHTRSEPLSQRIGDSDIKFENVSLWSGDPIAVWIEYNAVKKHLNVTIAPIDIPKPIQPLLSTSVDLSTVLLDKMYAGFSSATNLIQASHFVLGWSLKINGKAEDLDLKNIPKLPRPPGHLLHLPKIEKDHAICVPVMVALMTIFISLGIICIVIRNIRYGEVLEDWEINYGPHRFSYRSLYKATKGFSKEYYIGKGGCGMVYRGVLSHTENQVAVKKIYHGSENRMKEFVAEIASIGRIRHPNLVRLQGYCQRKRELILVYDFMVNGSMENFIYDNAESVLGWSRRFQIIKQVASGVLFLHEEWTQVVVHRDIKAANILLDGNMNGKLGDFGLSRLYQHGADPQTTFSAGTIGYMAPELSRIGKVSTSIDVFAFGVVMLEVACGRKPIDPNQSIEKVSLVGWVSKCFSNGTILQAVDWKLGTDFAVNEMLLVLQLGLLCCNDSEEGRPSMRQVIEYLNNEKPLPGFSVNDFRTDAATSSWTYLKKDNDLVMSVASIETVSILYNGR